MAGSQGADRKAALLPAEDARRTTIALFDLDRTLLPGSSLVALAKALAGMGVVSRRQLVGAAVRDVQFRRLGATDAMASRAQSEALAAVAGVERTPLLELVHGIGADLAATITPGARMLLSRHLTAGDFCVLLSASPQELVEAVCSAVGAHRAVGTRGEVRADRFTGRLDGPFCYGKGKVTRLRQALGPVDLSAAWSYADSVSDLPLLEACGHPVAVNADRRLRTIAAARGWPIIDVHQSR